MAQVGAFSRTGAQLRAALLSGVAVTALWTAAPAEAGPDLCTTAANVATCSGDQSGGINAGADFPVPQTDTLIIENLTQDIGAFDIANGVRWATNTGPINVLSNTGDFAIRSTADAILLSSSGDLDIELDHTGNIFASGGVGGNGIRVNASGFAGETGDVSVTMLGNIVASDFGLIATSRHQPGDGNSGDVTVDFTGDIVANGLGASAIFAESGAAANGNSGAAFIFSDGNFDGHIIAQSIVGGNGDSGFARVTLSGTLLNNSLLRARSVVLGDGDAGAAQVLTDANINGFILAESVVEGAGAASGALVETSGIVASAGTAITARSLGSAGQGLVEVVVRGGRVAGATAAIEIDGGLNGGTGNIVDIRAGAAVLSPGSAILGGDGDEKVENGGLVDGNVSLGGGANEFVNQTGAIFNTGTVVDLGGLGSLNNAGLMSLGGSASAAVTTTLTGDFTQDGDGVLAIDVFGGVADRLNVSGTVDLAGLVRATVSGLTSSTQQFTILSAAGGITDNGIDVEDTALFDFELIFLNANDLILEVTADFALADVILTPNQQAVADHLDDALGAGGGNLGAVFAHLGSLPDDAAVAAALDRLHPEPYLAQTQSLLFGNLAFADGLMSCDATAARFLSEGECSWVRAGGRHLEASRTTENIGFTDDVWSASAGAQKEIAPNRFVSFAAGYDNSDQDVDDRAVADGHVFHAGAAYKQVQGNWLIAGALSGGYASYDTTRLDVLPGVNAGGDARYGFTSARMRAAYLFERESLHIKPMIDVDATAIRRSSFHETGAGGAGLDVEGDTDFMLSIAPAIEIGAEFTPTEGSVLRPFVRAGIRAFSDDELEVSATFYSLPELLPLTVTTPMDQVMGQVSAGLDVVTGDRFDARVSYDGLFGDRLMQHAGNVKVRMKF